jgi:hypothetical protein
MLRSRSRPSNHFHSWLCILPLLLGGSLAAASTDPLFREDFSTQEPGKLPQGFMRLDGRFEVVEIDGQRHLQLPGSPLESFGVLFGPGRREDWTVTARFHGTRQGRRYPVFGVSLNGVSGYRLQVAPAKRELELLKGDSILTGVPFEWTNDSWTHLRLQLRKTGEQSWVIEGRAWKAGTPEPDAWPIRWEETTPPIAGRAGIWGQPFSGTPILFDDLEIHPTTP